MSFEHGISARNYHYSGKRKRNLRVNNPRPLARDRKSLSQTSKPCAIQSCPLLTYLPWEIRMQIWRHIVGDKRFDIRLSPGRLTSSLLSTDHVGYRRFWSELYYNRLIRGLLQPERLDISHRFKPVTKSTMKPLTLCMPRILSTSRI